MSLAKRLSAVQPENSFRRCGTCAWLETLPADDRAAFLDWIASDRSLTQLWEIAINDADHPYPRSLEALRACVRTHLRDQRGTS